MYEKSDRLYVDQMTFFNMLKRRRVRWSTVAESDRSMITPVWGRQECSIDLFNASSHCAQPQTFVPPTDRKCLHALQSIYSIKRKIHYS